MTLQFTLEENDFLQHQLFAASKSENLKKQKTKSRFVVSGALVLLGLLLLNNEDKILPYYFMVMGVLLFLFFPLLVKKTYPKHFKRYVNEVFKNRFGETISLTFNENTIETLSKFSELKLNQIALGTINEIQDYFFIDLVTGGNLIIPKYKISDVATLKEVIDAFAKRNNLKQKTELDWKWN